MPIVIHEFEVVAAPPPAREPAAPAPAPAGGPSPHDIVRIVRHEAERLERVRAC
jgi:hypothetical protein